MQALARGGTFVLVGMGSEACNCFPSMTLVSKEADVKGCFRYTNTVGFPAGLKPWWPPVACICQVGRLVPGHAARQLYKTLTV